MTPRARLTRSPAASAKGWAIMPICSSVKAQAPGGAHTAVHTPSSVVYVLLWIIEGRGADGRHRSTVLGRRDVNLDPTIRAATAFDGGDHWVIPIVGTEAILSCDRSALITVPSRAGTEILLERRLPARSVPGSERRGVR